MEAGSQASYSSGVHFRSAMQKSWQSQYTGPGGPFQGTPWGGGRGDQGRNDNGALATSVTLRTTTPVRITA